MTAAPCPACCTEIGERYGPADCTTCGGSGTDPATPRWTWTDEARGAVLRSAWNVNPGEAWDDDWVSADAVLAALAPHVARQVGNLTAENERLRDEVEAAGRQRSAYTKALAKVLRLTYSEGMPAEIADHMHVAIGEAMSARASTVAGGS